MPWPLPGDKAARLLLAKGYPYEAPASSYVFCRDFIDFSLPLNWQPEIFDERYPVIAHGSNRAPDQLRRKYGGVVKSEEIPEESADYGEIPVTLTRLYDYEVVYSAHMTRYGAVAANLQHAPGAAVDLFITWLDRRQLKRMHETELGGGIYRFGRLRDVRVDLPEGPLPHVTEVFVYLSRNGCLSVEGRPAGLSAIPTPTRRFPALSQLDALEFVRGRLHPRLALDEFILQVISDAGFRAEVIAALKADAVALNAPHFELLNPEAEAIQARQPPTGGP